MLHVLTFYVTRVDAILVDNNIVFVLIAVHQEGIAVEVCSQEHPTTNVLLG